MCNSMAYENMKVCLHKIFGYPTASSRVEESNAPIIKSEPVFIKHHENTLQVKDCPGYKIFLRITSSSRSFKMHNNLIGWDGRVLKCFKCNSMNHLTRYYSYQLVREVQNENRHIILLSTEIPILVKKALVMGVLDSACPRTLRGTLWLNAFLNVLTESDKTLITYSPSNTKYRFGGDVEVKFVKKAKFPVLLAAKSSLKLILVIMKFCYSWVEPLWRKQSWSWIFLGTWPWYLINL